MPRTRSKPEKIRGLLRGPTDRSADFAVTPVKTGIQPGACEREEIRRTLSFVNWIPACAEMTDAVNGLPEPAPQA
jgi:hypothetical protein